MRNRFPIGLGTALAAGCLLLAAGSALAAAPQRPYRNFSVAIYIPVFSTRQLADPKVLRQQFERIWSQVHFDKVYLEDYRGGVFADPASLDRIAGFFRRRGITVDGGITLTAPDEPGGLFSSFDYAKPQDIATAERAVRIAASHFDTVILDDFTFYNTRSAADIRAKGSLSWTRYRLQRMDWVAQHVILATAREANPHVKMIIKYPNWYEHFQGLGFDLDREAQMFDSIYTGTETRDPVATYQLLQQYESYEIFRYYSNIRPHGGDLGGWVDTFGTRYADRYAEQLWDTMLAKAPEITLFSWTQLAATAPAIAGERPWATQHTSFDWDAMESSFHAPPGSDAVAGWAHVAGYSLAAVDGLVGKLGTPIGIESYKPYQSSSAEDFLQNYLGNIGIPIDMTPHFPKGAPVVLLDEDAALDPDIVQEIEDNLQAGGEVIVTSGLLHALEHRGFENVAEISYSGLPIMARHYWGTFGPHGGGNLDVPGRKNRPVIFPQIHFYTNDAWPLIRGVASANAVPILLATQYARGELYVLDVPADMGDLYQLPQPVLDELRGYLLARFPVRIEAPALVSLFAYANHAFVVESYRAGPATVRVVVHGGAAKLLDLASGQAVLPAPAIGPGPAPGEEHETSFVLRLPPHSFRAFAIQ
jgi:hypothetical protein